MPTTPAQDALRELIKGKSDDEIVALLREAPGGAAGVLDITMAGMAEALDPDCAAGLRRRLRDRLRRRHGVLPH